jgi:hypothetical protein
MMLAMAVNTLPCWLRRCRNCLSRIPYFLKREFIPSCLALARDFILSMPVWFPVGVTLNWFPSLSGYAKVRCPTWKWVSSRCDTELVSNRAPMHMNLLIESLYRMCTEWRQCVPNVYQMYWCELSILLFTYFYFFIVPTSFATGCDYATTLEHLRDRFER